jgi:hypothetical protein
MNKAEFAVLVDTLLARVEAISYDDYSAGNSVLKDFEHLAAEHNSFLDDYTTEHVRFIRSDLEQMKKYKRHDLKLQHFRNVITGLRQDIASMKRNNFPE